MEADTSPDINKNKKEKKLEKVNDPEKIYMLYANMKELKNLCQLHVWQTSRQGGRGR